MKQKLYFFSNVLLTFSFIRAPLMPLWLGSVRIKLTLAKKLYTETVLVFCYLRNHENNINYTQNFEIFSTKFLYRICQEVGIKLWLPTLMNRNETLRYKYVVILRSIIYHFAFCHGNLGSLETTTSLTCSVAQRFAL